MQKNMKHNKEELLKYINSLKEKIRGHEVLQRMCADWNAPEDVLDLVPIGFADLDVSARTDHGVIYLSYKVLENDTEPDIENDHYLIHEISHYLQQCYGDKPTKGSNEGDYLNNEFEQEGFQNQTEYISDEYSKEDAVKYINRVLDKHEVTDPEEREDKAEVLLNIAQLRARRINGV